MKKIIAILLSLLLILPLSSCKERTEKAENNSSPTEYYSDWVTVEEIPETSDPFVVSTDDGKWAFNVSKSYIVDSSYVEKSEIEISPVSSKISQQAVEEKCKFSVLNGQPDLIKAWWNYPYLKAKLQQQNPAPKYYVKRKPKKTVLRAVIETPSGNIEFDIDFYVRGISWQMPSIDELLPPAT